MKKWLPWLILLLFVGYLAGQFRSPKTGEWDWQAFGKLPVMSNGRFQPIDSLARNSLLQLREKSSALNSTDPAVSAREREYPAAQWIAEMMFQPDIADTRPVFRIDNLELKQALALPVEPDDQKKVDGKHFSYQQLRPQLALLQEQSQQASSVKAELRNPYQAAVLKLWQHVQLYWKIQNLVQPRIEDLLIVLKAAPPMGAQQFLQMVEETKPRNAENWEAELKSFIETAPAGRNALMQKNSGNAHDEQAFAKLKYDLVRAESMSIKGMPLVIPTDDPKKAPDDWHSTGDALMSIAGGQAPHPALIAWAQIGSAFRAQDSAAFNRTVLDYHSLLAPQFASTIENTNREHLFNRLEPFIKAMAIYIFVGILALVFWFAPVKGEWLRRSAVLLCILAILIHSAGIIFRMTLEDRPPVTNLYSAAVFVGWGACVLGVILELFWKNSIGVLVSAIIGFATLLIAHHLAIMSGDTMEMMRAVLDSNFWLATHVVIISIGYSSTYVAGFLGLAFVLRGVFSPSLDAPLRQSIAKMIYAITCFATLFSFVGTVLGGIWADQSWGRFWGWDPKENGALIIVLWNALILHARWGGLVRERGLANLALFGNVVTTWSFFGTNMLGIGLHSYGFMDEQRIAFIAFTFSQFIIIGIGCLPLSLWRSYRADQTAKSEEPPAIPPAPQPA